MMSWEASREGTSIAMLDENGGALRADDFSKNTFVIGQARHPFDWYASLWSYLSESGASWVDSATNATLCRDPGAAPCGSTEEDVARFHKFVRLFAGKGEMGTYSKHLWVNYLDLGVLHAPAMGIESYAGGEGAEELEEAKWALGKFAKWTYPTSGASGKAGHKHRRQRNKWAARRSKTASMRRMARQAKLERRRGHENGRYHSRPKPTVTAMKTDSTQVQCWVTQENILEDLRACYSSCETWLDANLIDWDKFDANASSLSADGLEGERVATKDLYDDETRAVVVNADKYVFDFFGYSTTESGPASPAKAKAAETEEAPLAREELGSAADNLTDTCTALLFDHNRTENMLVLPEDGLLYCGNAKVGTTTITELLAKKFVLELGDNTTLRKCESSCMATAQTDKDSVWICKDGDDSCICAKEECSGCTECFTETDKEKEQRQAGHTGTVARVFDDVYQIMNASGAATKSLSKRVTSAADMNAGQKRTFCNKRPVSFSAVRSPWSRMVAGYLGKIAPGLEGPEVEEKTIEELQKEYNLKADETVTFSQFVRWVRWQPDPVNVHWSPQTLRCNNGLGLYAIEAHIEDGFEDDVKKLLRTLGWSEELYSEEHISSVKICVNQKSGSCVPALESQIGAVDTWQDDDGATLEKKLYDSDPDHDLRQLVHDRYLEDVEKLGYSAPDH